jgi:hypothetical protein
VFQVPSPITGNCSLEDGIARVSIDNDSVAPNKRDALIGKSSAPELAPINLAALRRVTFVMSSGVETSLNISETE